MTDCLCAADSLFEAVGLKHICVYKTLMKSRDSSCLEAPPFGKYQGKHPEYPNDGFHGRVFTPKVNPQSGMHQSHNEELSACLQDCKANESYVLRCYSKHDKRDPLLST